tara:strand:- start:2065 stop:2595 length:531 start_codon:yes stop_codon:yes gene_type:complete
MDKEGNLNYESKQRAKLAFKIFTKVQARFLITSGCDYREDSDICIADAFSNFLVKYKKMAKENIYCERNSRDTVGDAFFSNLNIYKKLKFNKLIVVTSDYHLKRAREIFEFIYASSIELEFSGVNMRRKDLNLDSEIDSLISFRKTFQNIEKGDMNSISENLFSKHPFYNGKVFKK